MADVSNCNKKKWLPFDDVAQSDFFTGGPWRLQIGLRGQQNVYDTLVEVAPDR